MPRHTIPILALLFLLTLNGCGAALNPYHEEFNCRARSDDGHCVDTPTAYREATSVTELAAGPNAPQSGTTATEQDLRSIRLQRLAALLKEPTAPLLEPPKVLRVLILPYRGDNGELFMARYAYLNVEPAQWVLTETGEGASR